MAVCCEYFYLAGTTKGEWIQTPGRCIEVVYYESRKIIYSHLNQQSLDSYDIIQTKFQYFDSSKENEFEDLHTDEDFESVRRDSGTLSSVSTMIYSVHMKNVHIVICSLLNLIFDVLQN